MFYLSISTIMEYSVAIVCTASLLGGGIYLFVFMFGATERKGKRVVDFSGGSIDRQQVQENYNKYQSFFRRPKQIENAENVPAFVDTFYNLVTDIYEWGWGQSFHFAPSISGKSKLESIRIYEEMAVDLIGVKPGQKILDAGCGVGGPMRAIATHSGCNVVGITINDYQVSRAKAHNKKAGLEKQCEVICGNFLEMPFEDESFDGAYSIDATCHAPKLEDVYSEIFRVLKPGSMYVSYEWVTTELYKDKDPEHVEIIHEIEIANALPGLRSFSDIVEAAKKVGFEVVKEKDLAKPPANPWWLILKMGRIELWSYYILVMVLDKLGIVPNGTIDVYEMLLKTRDYLVQGGQAGIFSPMHMILCRKPKKQQPAG